MKKTKVKFVDELPEDGRGKSWRSLLAALKANPGRWAVYKKSGKPMNNVAGTKRLAHPECEWACRGNILYVRWVNK